MGNNELLDGAYVHLRGLNNVLPKVVVSSPTHGDVVYHHDDDEYEAVQGLTRFPRLRNRSGS